MTAPGGRLLPGLFPGREFKTAHVVTVRDFFRDFQIERGKRAADPLVAVHGAEHVAQVG